MAQIHRWTAHEIKDVRFNRVGTCRKAVRAAVFVEREVASDSQAVPKKRSYFCIKSVQRCPIVEQTVLVL